MKKFLSKIKSGIERFIPMTIGNLLLFGFLIYLIIVVSQSVYSNYNSNQEIDKQGEKLVTMKREIVQMQNAINYYQTPSFREKEAREKLGYKAPGESVISLPIDTIEDKMADSGLAEVKIKTPNYRLWWQYFFSKRI